MEKFTPLISTFLEFDGDGVLSEVEKLLRQQTDPFQIAEAARDAMIKIGVLFEKKEIFLTELMMASEIFKDLMVKLEISSKTPSNIPPRATIIIGTVKGDIHDIGKNIVKGLLVSRGYRIIDLGVDVPAEKFIDAIKTEKPQIIGLSGLLTGAYASMKQIISAISSAGVRDYVKIMIGGGAVDQSVCTFVSADGFGVNAIDALKLADKWVQR